MQRFVLIRREYCPVAYGPVAVRLQYEDPDEASGICPFIRYLQGFYKLPEKDSNLRLLIQSRSSPVSARTRVSGNCADLQGIYNES
jgi:hypothetical protein